MINKNWYAKGYKKLGYKTDRIFNTVFILLFNLWNRKCGTAITNRRITKELYQKKQSNG